MKNKEKLIDKIHYFEAKLSALEGYYHVEETYHYLQSELDSYLMQLQRIEAEEEMARIDAENDY